MFQPVVKYNKVVYDFSRTHIRDNAVKNELIMTLNAAAISANIDYVTITSGSQPGTTGKRTGSTRHDTGLAADLYVTYKGRILDGSNAQDQLILTRFIQAAVANGIKAGGMSEAYMGNYTMHLDMLGGQDGEGRYDGTLITWESNAWFTAALKGTSS